jgi:hypothetical protein
MARSRVGDVRVANRSSSYTCSALSRYLEEALAETAAQVGVNGLRAGFQGVTFPVKSGCVTLLREVQVGQRIVRPFSPELGGLSVEAFIFGGIAYETWWTTSEPSRRRHHELATLVAVPVARCSKWWVVSKRRENV